MNTKRHVRLVVVVENARVTVLWRGDPAQGNSDGLVPVRLEPVVAALGAHGYDVRALGFVEEYLARTRDACLASRAVLVWVDPLSGDRDRRFLEELLRECVAAGTAVYTDPDVVLAMGTKDVLYDTRELSWGIDVDRHENFEEFVTRFSQRVRAGETRVVKQRRGNAGRGVWRVAPVAPEERLNDVRLRIQHAAVRDGSSALVTWSELVELFRPYFDDGGHLIDQAFVERVGDGMVRAYLVKNEVVGFARQYAVREDHSGRTIAPEFVFAMASAKTMRPADDPEFATLRTSLESEWVPALERLVGVERQRLPLLWDADFLFGPRGMNGEESYRLCEINVSCVTPFPPSAPEKMARALHEDFAAR